MKTAYLGSVSSGTKRTEDLIEAFVSVLDELSENGENEELIREARTWLELPELDHSDKTEDWGADIVQEMFDAIEAAAPPYSYFGAHPGDGADYGFWLHEDFQQMFRDDGGLEVSDTSEVPADYQGEVLHINDHGNATLYVADRGALSEVWSVV